MQMNIMTCRDLPVVGYHADSRASMCIINIRLVRAGCVTENRVVKLVPHKSLNTQF